MSAPAHFRSDFTLFWVILLLLFPFRVNAFSGVEIPDEEFFTEDLFVFIVKTGNPGVSGNNEFTIPTNPDYDYSYEVDWDYNGNSFNPTENPKGDATHQYPGDGLYAIAIRGDFPQIFFNDDHTSPTRLSDAQKLVDIVQWGEIVWLDMSFSFSGCVNLNGTVTDPPNLDEVNNMEAAFRGCSNLNMDMSDWNVDNVENFRAVFQEASMFNSDISGWNVGNGEDFSDMFLDAGSFDQNLGTWNLGSASDLSDFLSNSGLSQSTYDMTLAGWESQNMPSGLTVGVSNLHFCQSEVMRKILIDSLGWTFDGDTKDCPFVMVVKTDNYGEFSSDTEYRIPVFLSSSLTYNYDVDWTYDGVTFQAEDSNVTDTITHDYGTPGTYTIAIRGQFPAFYSNAAGPKADPEKILAINQWGDIEWSSMLAAFNGCSNLVINASDLPDLTAVSSYINTFRNCLALSTVPNMRYWDVSNGQQFSYMFAVTQNFNEDISTWDVSSASHMNHMFYLAEAFNQDLGDWEVGNVEDFSSTFRDAKAFNQDLSQWDVSESEEFDNMFRDATAFNQSLGTWNLSSATNINGMLRNCSMDTDNYDATLIGWANTGVPDNLNLDALTLEYCNGEMARNTLLSTYNWTISGDQLDCGGQGGNCPNARTVIQVDIAPGITLSAGETLETSGAVTINSGDDITFTAGTTIILTPGFSAQGPFTARIEACAGNTSADDLAADRELPGASAGMPSGKKQPKIALKVFPNPANGPMTFRFQISNAGPVNLHMFTLKGELVKTLLQDQIVDRGTMDVTWSDPNLPTGMYLAQLKTSQGLQTVKVIVRNF